MENNLDYKELGSSIVFWKVNDASQSFEISRGFNGRVGVEFVEGDFTDRDVTMEVYCDGVHVASKTVTNDSLLTWPPVRCREIIIKLKGKATIENVFVASSAMEIYQNV